MSPESTRTPFLAWLDRLDQKLVGLMSAHGIRLLRWAMSVVYLWFGYYFLRRKTVAAA